MLNELRLALEALRIFSESAKDSHHAIQSLRFTRVNRLLQAALIYFFVVFGTGFVLGTIRVVLMVPLIGVRDAELSESPLMLFATVVCARWVNQRFCSGFGGPKLLGVGLIAVILMLVADFFVGVGLRGMTPLQVFTERDAVSGSVYYGLLGLFALMPWLLGRNPTRLFDGTPVNAPSEPHSPNPRLESGS